METQSATTDLPPIVVLVDEESDSRDMYATRLEMAGFWVAVERDTPGAMQTVGELRPNAIVASINFDGRTDGLRFVRAVKERSDTRDIPLVVLSGRPFEDLPRGARQSASVLLLKPVAPDTLALSVRELLAKSHDLRRRAEMLAAKVHRLVDESAHLRGRREQGVTPRLATRRTCPRCANTLEWLERGAVDDVEYDYYRWCPSGCGLYCFDRTANSFMKLA